MTHSSDDELLKLIGSELGVAPGLITFDRMISDIPGWDSLAWIRIITAIETDTGKLFPVDRIDDVRNVGDLLALMQS